MQAGSCAGFPSLGDGHRISGKSLRSLRLRRRRVVAAAARRSGCNGLELHVDHYSAIAVRTDAVYLCVCVRQSGGW